MTGQAIRGFQGEHRWLSNFWPCEVIGRDGTRAPTVEHAFQACKFPAGSDAFRRVIACKTPGEAKKLARTLPGLRPDWANVKVNLMYRLLKRKFAPGSELAEKLLATGEADLVEDNQWNDTFWGVCRGKGLNTLGKLLMRVRGELRG